MLLEKPHLLIKQECIIDIIIQEVLIQLLNQKNSLKDFVMTSDLRLIKILQKYMQ
jgi:hypothetical protein